MCCAAREDVIRFALLRAVVGQGEHPETLPGLEECEQADADTVLKMLLSGLGGAAGRFG